MSNWTSESENDRLKALGEHPRLLEEIFRPAGILTSANPDQLPPLINALPGNPSATIFADDNDRDSVAELLPFLRRRTGRIVFNVWPTGVSVGWATQHGGPWPATNQPNSTSVGLLAIRRFRRPIAYQGLPDELLAPALQNGNRFQIMRNVNGNYTDCSL
jgi:NADP-dependent aldehyde dehydrogenase